MAFVDPATDKPIIHIVDDDAAVRAALGRLLKAAGYEFRSYESARVFLEQVPKTERGCIVLDVQMPGLTGPELQVVLARIGCVLPIVFLTGHGDIAASVRAIKAGAEDFLAKPVPKQALLDAIGRALDRYDKSMEQRTRAVMLQERLARLTPREREVLNLVVRGKLNKQIAHELAASERTIKAHRHKIMEKFEANSLAELVSIAEHLGLLTE